MKSRQVVERQLFFEASRDGGGNRHRMRLRHPAW
jgi:hypothetical protein